MVPLHSLLSWPAGASDFSIGLVVACCLVVSCLPLLLNYAVPNDDSLRLVLLLIWPLLLCKWRRLEFECSLWCLRNASLSLSFSLSFAGGLYSARSSSTNAM